MPAAPVPDIPTTAVAALEHLSCAAVMLLSFIVFMRAWTKNGRDR